MDAQAVYLMSTLATIHSLGVHCSPVLLAILPLQQCQTCLCVAPELNKPACFKLWMAGLEGSQGSDEAPASVQWPVKQMSQLATCEWYCAFIMMQKDPFISTGPRLVESHNKQPTVSGSLLS